MEQAGSTGQGQTYTQTDLPWKQMTPPTRWARHQTRPPWGPPDPLKAWGPPVSGIDHSPTDAWTGVPPVPWGHMQPVPGAGPSPTWQSYLQEEVDPIEEVCCRSGTAFVPMDAACPGAGPMEGAGIGSGVDPRARGGDLSGADAGDSGEVGMP